VISEEAGRVGMPYVSHRWLGGLLTNFATIDNRIKRMHELRKLKTEGQLSLLPTKERMAMERELEKLEVNLGGVSGMTRLPDAVFVADPKREAIATKEVNKLGLPLIGLCDTNCDPDEVEYVIPGNDDAIRSCSLIVKTLTRAVEEGRQKVQVAEFLAAEAARSAELSRAAAYGPGDSVSEGAARPSRAPRGPGSPAGDDRSRGTRRPGPDGRSGPDGRPGAGRGFGEGVRRGPRPEGGARPAPARRAPLAQPAAARVPEPKEAPAAAEAAPPVVEPETTEVAAVVEAPVVEVAPVAEAAVAAEAAVVAESQTAEETVAEISATPAEGDQLASEAEAEV